MNIMQMLRRLLADAAVRKPEFSSTGHRKRIVSFTLLLGPSVYCPKEIYYFDLPCQWSSDDINATSKAAADQFPTSVLRQFYK